MTPSRERAARAEFLQDRNLRLKRSKSARLEHTAAKMRAKALANLTPAQIAQRTTKQPGRESESRMETK